MTYQFLYVILVLNPLFTILMSCKKVCTKYLRDTFFVKEVFWDCNRWSFMLQRYDSKNNVDKTCQLQRSFKENGNKQKDTFAENQNERVEISWMHNEEG